MLLLSKYICFEFKQVKLVKVFPLRYWGIMLSCVMAAIQSAVIGACVNPSKEAWRLDWNLQLITILYSVRSFAELCLASKLSSIQCIKRLESFVFRLHVITISRAHHMDACWIEIERSGFQSSVI